MRELTEIRWHARAGQGAKTASQLLALALLRTGKSVQAFPEYGPERRGAPLRAYTRISNERIRRHDAIEHPDVVVVLEPSLVGEANVDEGLGPEGLVLLNAERVPSELGDRRVCCVPATELASKQGSSFANVVMVGAVAAALGEPPLEDVQEAAVETLGRKLPVEAVRAAVAEGYGCLS
ncbi:MAG TPA: 2-oxoacid:acceptor oxidoreductase family protein [Gaiellaceae bacterium]|nr:2-oxoacid:acceptor oxidoreductase family protein [Gaiellaceae bacterium]